MKKTLFALAAGVAVAGCCSLCCGDKPYSEDIDEGFVSLFNGKDLSGWVGATGMYGVETIKVKMRGTQREKDFQVLSCFPERHVKGQPGNLCTEKEYASSIVFITWHSITIYFLYLAKQRKKSERNALTLFPVNYVHIIEPLKCLNTAC